MGIPGTNTIFNMRPNKSFVQTHYYSFILATYHGYTIVSNSTATFQASTLLEKAMFIIGQAAR